MKRIRTTFFLLLTTFILVFSSLTITYAKPRISRKSITISEGEKKKLKIAGTKKKPKWSSKNKRIAKVNKKGVVTGVRSGKTTIIAKVGKKKYKCTVNVIADVEPVPVNSSGYSSDRSESSGLVPVTWVSVTPYHAYIEEEKSTQLSAEVYPSDATNKRVTWSSENPSIATVSQNGVVTGICEGETKITATCGNESDFCYVTVEARPPVEGRDYRVAVSELKFYEQGGEQHCNAIYEITNIGSRNLKINSAVYDFYNANNRLVATEDWVSGDPEIIKPGEKGYTWSNFTNLKIPVGNYTLKPTFKMERTFKTGHSYPISSLQTLPGDYGTAVKHLGTITNNTGKKISYLYIVFLLYGQNGKVIGIHGTSVSDIAPGATQGFETSSLYLADYITYDMVKNCKAVALDADY